MNDLKELFEKYPEFKKAYDDWNNKKWGNSWTCGCPCCFLTQAKHVLKMEIPEEYKQGVLA